MTGSEKNSPSKICNEDQRFKLIDFLIKRLDHTLSHTQTATRLIYLVNGAILAAVYFEFGKVQPSAAFLVAGVLTLLLSIINYLHANFHATQNTWYRTIDEEIRNIFISFPDIKDVWPRHLGESYDRVWKSYKGCYGKLIRHLFLFKRTHRIYVWIHIVVAFFLFFISVYFFYLATNPPNVFIGAQSEAILRGGK